MNDNFVLEIVAQLNSKGIKTDYETLKKEFKKNGVEIDTVINTSKSKTELQKFISEYAPKLQKMFNNIGVNVDLKSIETSMKSVLSETEKSAKQTSNSVQKAFSDLRKEAYQGIGEKPKILQDMSKYYTQLEEESKNTANEVQKAYVQMRKEAYQGIGEKTPELSDMSTYYKNLGNEAQKAMATQKKLYLDEEQAYKTNANIKIAEEKKLQVEIKKTVKEKQDEIKLQNGREILTNNISSYLRNNTKIGENFRQKLLEIQSAIKTADKTKLNELKANLRSVTSEIEAAGKSGDSVTAKLGKNVKQLLSFFGSTTIVMGSVRAVQSMVSNVTDLNKAMVSLKKVTNNTNQEYSNFLNNAGTTAKELGSSISDLVNQSADWAKAGYGLTDSANLAKVSSIFQNVGDVDAATSVSDIITPLKAFNLQANSAIDVVNKLNEVDNRFAVSSADLGDGLKNSASALALAGNDINQTIAMITGSSEITQNASEQGNALKVLSMRIRGMKGELEKLGEEYDNIESVSKIQTHILNTTGGKVNIMDDLDPSKFKSTYEIIKEIAKVYDKLSQTKQADLLETIAGKQRGNQVAALISAFQSGQIQKAYDVSANQSQNSALQEQEKWAKGIEYSTKRITASWQELSKNTIHSSWIKGIVDIANALVNVTDKVGLFNIAVLALSGVIGTKLMTIFPNLAISIAEFATTAGIGADAAIGLGSALSTMLPVAAILGGITLITKAYDYFNTSLSEQKEALETANTSYQQSKSDLESVNKELQTASQRMDELNAKDNLTFVEKDELDKLKATTEELLVQQDVLEKLNAEKSKGVVNETVNTYNKQFGSENVSAAKVQEYQDNANSTGNNLALISDSNNINAMIAGYRQLIELKNQATKSGDTDAVKEYTQSIGDVTSSLTTNIQTLNDLKTKLTSVSFDKNTEEFKNQQKAIENIDSAIKLIYTNIDPNKWKDIQLGKILSDDDTKKVVDNLQQLSKAGKLDESTLTSNKKYSDILKQTGLTASDVVEQINAITVSTDKATASTENTNNTIADTTTSLYGLATASETATGYVNDLGKDVDVSKMQSQIQSATTAVSDFKTMLKSMKENKGITSDILDTITSKYPKFLAYMGNEKELRKKLEQGIKDQKKVAKDYYRDLLELDSSFYNSFTKRHSKLINELGTYYNVDLGNFKSLAEAKFLADTTLITQLKAKWADYYTKKNNLDKLENDKANNEIPNFSGDFTSIPNPLDNEVYSKVHDKERSSVTKAKTKAKKEQSEFDKYLKMLKSAEKDINLDLSGITASGDNTSGSGKDKNEFSQVFDWLSIRIDKLKDKAQKAIDSIAKYTSYKTKNSKVDIAVQAKVDEKSSLKSIQDNYNKLADKVNLPQKYKDLVDNGGMNVQTIKDEKLANKIEAYQKWKDAAKSTGDEISKISDEIKELNKQKLDNITSYFDSKNSTTEARISKQEQLIATKQAQGKTVSKTDYQYLINRQKTLKTNAQDEYNAYKSEFDAQVKDGSLKYGSDAWKSANAQLITLESNISKVDEVTAGLQDSINNLPIAKLDNKLKSLNSSQQKIEDSISLKEAKGGTASKSDYTGLIKVSNDKIATIKKENEEYKAQQKGLKETDTLYIDLQQKIDDNLSAISACKVEQANWNTEIRELDWKSFDKGITKINNMKDEMSDLASLISDEDSVDSRGKLTKDGLTKLGLYSKQMSANQQLVYEYGQAIETLKIELSKGIISQEQYNEDLANYQGLQRDAVADTESMKDAIVSLSKARVDTEVKAINKETDAFKESVEAKKAALTAEEELHDYQKSISEQSATIAQLDKQIAILKLSTDRKSNAQRLQLEKERTDKQKALEDDQYKHSITVQTNALDDEATKYEKSQQAKIDTLEKSLEDEKTLVSNALNEVLANTVVISDGIKSLENEHGLTVTESIVSPWISATSAIEAYKSALASISGNNTDSQFSIGKGISVGLQTGIGSNSYSSNSLSSVKPLSGIVTGIQTAIGTKKKVKKYAKGITKIPYDQLGITQDGGQELITRPSDGSIATYLKAGDGVINADLTKNLIEWGKFNPNTTFNLDTKMPNLSAITPKQSLNIDMHYDTLLNVEGSIDKSFDVSGIVKTAIDKNNATLVTLIKQNR